MDTTKSISKLQGFLDTNDGQLDFNTLQGLIDSSIQNETAFFKNSTAKIIARLLLKHQGHLAWTNEVEQDSSGSLILLDLVQSLGLNQEPSNSFPSNALHLLSVDEEWLTIIIEAVEHNATSPKLFGLIEHILHHCALNEQHLKRLLEICYQRKDKDHLAFVLQKCFLRPNVSLEGRINLMKWLIDHDYSEQFQTLLEESLILYAYASADYRKLILFMKDCEKWLSLIAYTYRMLEYDQGEEDSIDVQWLTAELIWAYLQLKEFEKIALVYQNYWLETEASFPYTNYLFQHTHLIPEGEALILADLCAKMEIDEEETNPALLAILAKQLEYQGEWGKAYQIWQQIVKDAPQNPAYLRFTALNILEHLHRPRQARIFGERLGQMKGYEQMGRAIMALANKGYFNAFLNYVFEYDLYLEKGDKIYDLLLRELIPALWNERNMWSTAKGKSIISMDGEIIHPALIDRTDFTLRSIIGRYIELNRILSQEEHTAEDPSRFINMFKLILSFDLSTTHLRALLQLINTAEKITGFFKKDEFDDFESAEIKELRATFLWLLAKRAELEYEQKDSPDKETENLIATMELHNAEQVFKKLNSL